MFSFKGPNIKLNPNWDCPIPELYRYSTEGKGLEVSWYTKSHPLVPGFVDVACI
jgi:hypothetical protein